MAIGCQAPFMVEGGVGNVWWRKSQISFDMRVYQIWFVTWILSRSWVCRFGWQSHHTLHSRWQQGDFTMQLWNLRFLNFPLLLTWNQTKRWLNSYSSKLLKPRKCVNSVMRRAADCKTQSNRANAFHTYPNTHCLLVSSSNCYWDLLLNCKTQPKYTKQKAAMPSIPNTHWPLPNTWHLTVGTT